MVNQLNRYNMIISKNKERDQNEQDGKGRYTNKELEQQALGLNFTPAIII